MAAAAPAEAIAATAALPMMIAMTVSNIWRSNTTNATLKIKIRSRTWLDRKKRKRVDAASRASSSSFFANIECTPQQTNRFARLWFFTSEAVAFDISLYGHVDHLP